MEQRELKKTALYNAHLKSGGKMIPFAGYYMPVQYRGIIAEHLKVRSSVGVFDVSHMGEFVFTGEKALDMIQKVTINDASRIEEYQAQYSAMCNSGGGIIDDVIIYRFPDKYLMVVNAANKEKDYNWILDNSISDVLIEDISDEIILLAVQGAKSLNTLKKLTDYDLESIEYFHFAEIKLADKEIIISKTGYTGEMGFELFINAEDSEHIWDMLFTAGQEYDIEPIGLGARDTLRLEKKYCLYGNDITEDTNPFEVGLGWIIKLDKGDFIGREALVQIKQEGVKRKLIGYVVEGRAFPRTGYEIFENGSKIGFTTSGTMSPSLGKGIGIAYVDKEYSKTGTEFDVIVRGKPVKAEVVKTPFV